jgi:hypothetical protein
MQAPYTLHLKRNLPNHATFQASHTNPDMDDLRKAAPKRTLSDVDSELLNINFFETPTTFGDL